MSPRVKATIKDPKPAHLALVLSALLFTSIPPLHGQTTIPLAGNHAETALALSAESPTLLLFLRADQQQSLEELSQLPSLAKDHPTVKVLAILSGDDASSSTPKFAEKCPWPIIPDTTYAASGKFEVHVWPTTVLVAPQNGGGGGGAKTIAHIPGLPISFASDLSAYLDFATNRIDRATLNKRLANRDLVVDTSDQKAARHIEVAHRLAAQGMKEEARAELARASSLNPADPLLRLSIARIHLILADPASAQKILNDPGLQNVAPLQLGTLKAWAAIQTNNFPLARQLLESSLALNPDPAEADYLYGLVLLHDNDAAKAATYFRQAFEHSELGKQFNPAP
ncbi:MAG: tetratricopeptide repeat protein [Phycisphaerae bacterium]